MTRAASSEPTSVAQALDAEERIQNPFDSEDSEAQRSAWGGAGAGSRSGCKRWCLSCLSCCLGPGHSRGQRLGSNYSKPLLANDALPLETIRRAGKAERDSTAGYSVSGADGALGYRKNTEHSVLGLREDPGFGGEYRRMSEELLEYQTPFAGLMWALLQSDAQRK
jgi:hypothetical protein